MVVDTSPMVIDNLFLEKILLPYMGVAANVVVVVVDINSPSAGTPRLLVEQYLN